MAVTLWNLPKDRAYVTCGAKRRPEEECTRRESPLPALSVWTGQNFQIEPQYEDLVQLRHHRANFPMELTSESNLTCP